MPQAPVSDHPGVRFPPPLLFVAGLGGGVLLHRAWPAVLVPGVPLVRLLVAWGLVAAGLGLALWGIVTFRRARTAVFPHFPASRIVSRGPYRFTRNPMYVGLTLLYLGLGLWVNSLWPVVLLPLVLAALVRFVVRREEAYLSRAFGAEYDAYRARVRRWL